MHPIVPAPPAPAHGPSTKVWLLLLSLLAILLVASHQLRPAAAPAALAGRPAASPRLELRRPAPRPAVAFAASASL